MASTSLRSNATNYNPYVSNSVNGLIAYHRWIFYYGTFGDTNYANTKFLLALLEGAIQLEL